MAIYRGDGGAGDATNDITINQITELSSEAQASADAAASSATDAETSASAASTSATNAANSATSAGTSATNAASSASSASTSASNASTSETNAAASETNAATSATNAATSETNASNSATAAASSAGVAALNATSAADSASSAATSASNAATSETNAASSATSASSDAATATTKASEASTSASNAATSETNAAASESAAATSATNASTSETNAAASETAAASSASAAATSATNASTSETNAATSASSASTSASAASTSATAAATSATNAETAYDNFDDRYLGAKSSAPTLDNDGDALITGALYFDTTDTTMYVYTGSAWIATYASDQLSNVVEDTTPQLGGDLDTNGNAITGSTVAINSSNGEFMISATENGPVVLRYDNNLKLSTKSDGVNITGELEADSLDIDGNGDISGNLTLGGNLNLGDNDKAIFGASSDLQIYHDGSHSFISDQGTGELRILATDLRINNSASSKTYLRAIDGGALTLYHNGSSKLATASTGVNVTGTVTATGGNSTNWNTAYGWGDHSTAGYLTAATAADTDLSNLSATGERRVCHIYCKWNGTGTVTILDSNNVSSITDNGTGQYTLNFSITMANSNYAFVTSSSRTSGQSAMGNLGFTDGTTNTTTALSLNNRGASSNRDNANLSVAIFGD